MALTEMQLRQDLRETRSEVRELRRQIDTLERRMREYERNEQRRAESRQWYVIYAVNGAVALLSFIIVLVAVRANR